jgi:hypothetical protein
MIDIKILSSRLSASFSDKVGEVGDMSVQY